MSKRALITGITGQDGAYLAELLLGKGYEVHGIKRRTSSFNSERIDHLYHELDEAVPKVHLHYGDLTDSLSLLRVMQLVQPDEIYNLGAQSHVAVSFEEPEFTANADALGTLRLLEAMRILGLGERTRFYQASTSELFGLVQQSPQSETTPFHPRSPYGVAKLYAHWITQNYREAYGLYACSGILFNHESPLRGETFVTRKITRGLARCVYGLQQCVYLGNLDARRDWGHARDYIIATGHQHTVREFVELAAQALQLELEFSGSGLEQTARVVRCGLPGSRLQGGEVVVRIHPRYFRPAEVDTLVGDASRAARELGWRPRVAFPALVAEMAEADRRLAERETQGLIGSRHGRHLIEKLG